MKPPFALLISLYLAWCCSSLLEWDPNGNLIAHSYSIWGDWSAHFTFIENIRERGISWISGDNPIFAGAPFQYPFLSHLITAFFGTILGMTTIGVTEASSLILIFLAPLLVYRAYQQFGLKPLSSFVGTAVFFLAGGYQWMDLLGPAPNNPREPLSNQFEQLSVFTQFVGFELYPQRAFGFGLVILTWVGFWALKKHQAGRFTLRTAIMSGFALSALALTHVHSYLALASFLLFYFLFHRNRKVFIYCLGIAVVGCASLAFLLLRNQKPEFQGTWEYWLPGWALSPKAGLKAASDMNPITFWILNTGLYLPMAWAGFWFAHRQLKAYPLARVWFGAGMFLFVLANLFNLQPYWYDNLKTFTYSFFFLAPFIGVFFERVLLTRRALYPVAAALFFMQVNTGVQDLYFLKTQHQNATFFTTAEFSIAEEFKKLRHSADDLVVISPRHNHWVPCLTGSPIFMGFPGWLWTWGINYGSREREVNAVLMGLPEAAQIISNQNLAYVVVHVGDRVQERPVNYDYLRSHFSSILNRDGWEIFSLRSPATSVR